MTDALNQDDEYIAAARLDPEVRRMNRVALYSLALHLWSMTREERAKVTVESLRISRRLLHGYITDAEIDAVIRQETDRVWIDPLRGLLPEILAGGR